MILCILRPYFFVENDFFKPTHPRKVWKIPHFFLKPSIIHYELSEYQIFFCFFSQLILVSKRLRHNNHPPPNSSNIKKPPLYGLKAIFSYTFCKTESKWGNGCCCCLILYRIHLDCRLNSVCMVLGIRCGWCFLFFL